VGLKGTSANESGFCRRGLNAVPDGDTTPPKKGGGLGGGSRPPSPKEKERVDRGVGENGTGSTRWLGAVSPMLGSGEEGGKATAGPVSRRAESHTVQTLGMGPGWDTLINALEGMGEE